MDVARGRNVGNTHTLIQVIPVSIRFHRQTLKKALFTDTTGATLRSVHETRRHRPLRRNVGMIEQKRGFSSVDANQTDKREAFELS